MQLPGSALKLFCLVIFSLLAACSGSERQQKPPQAASSQDTIAVDTAKTFKEKYAGYEVIFKKTEYMYENDANAPVIYAQLDTIIDEAYKAINITGIEIRESRSTMDSLPETIQIYLQQNSIVVPGFKTKSNHNFIHQNLFLKGKFRENSQQDWAVMCAKDGFCWITIFWDGVPTDTAMINYKSIEQSFKPLLTPKSIYLTDNEEDGSLFVAIGIFTCLSKSYNYYFWPNSPPRPEKFSHNGLTEFDPEQKHLLYYYFDSGKLLTWGSGMGWEEWYELDRITMPDSMLLNPVECPEIPPSIASEWEKAGRKIAFSGENSCCITGEFIQEGRTDIMVFTCDPIDGQYTGQVSLMAIVTSELDSMIIATAFSVEEFKFINYNKIDHASAKEDISHYRDLAKDPYSLLYTENDDDLEKYMPELSLKLDCLDISHYHKYQPLYSYIGIIYFQNKDFNTVLFNPDAD